MGPAYAVQLALRRWLPPGLLIACRAVLLELATRAPSAPGAEIRFAGPHERDLLAGFGHSAEELERRLGRGDRVCVLAPAGRLEAYAWFHTEVYEEPDLRTRFRMASNEIWLYDAMVAPELRGRGVYPRLLAGAARGLAEQGFERVLILVEEGNRNSVRAHRAGGATPFGRIGALGAFGWARVRDERTRSTCWLAPGRWYETDTRPGSLTAPTARA